MIICILCKDDDLIRARKDGKKLFPKTDEDKNLVIPVSKSGLEPATHWFCFMNAPENIYNYLIDINDYGIVENIQPKEFLLKNKLKMIK